MEKIKYVLFLRIRIHLKLISEIVYLLLYNLTNVII